MDKNKNETTNKSLNIPKINMLQLSSWISKATCSNKGFLLKPNDLRILYMLVLWEYVSKNNSTEKIEITDLMNIECDSQIEIPEDELVKLVKLLFHHKYYAYFNKIFNM